jgi:uncharacterized protein (TIGR02678 family)
MTETGEAAARAPRRWMQRSEAKTEIAAVLRVLMAQPWRAAGRDDGAIATVRRHEQAVSEVFGRLGWVLVLGRDFVRLRKSPPVRRQAWAGTGPAPLTCSWFFLLVAAAESMPPRVAIGQLVAAARAAAAEVGLPAPDDRSERYAILAALKMLDHRKVVETIDGDPTEFLRDDNAPVLLAVHHHRLVHVIANFAAADPVADPVTWLDQVEREADPARRMRRKLVDDTAVYACDLDVEEADWLSRRVRGDDGLPLAEAFGLHLERRAEGAAFVVPVDAFRSRSELGESPFPAGGTVAHAALLLCDVAAADGLVDPDRPGWRGMARDQIRSHLESFAERFAGHGWSGEYIDNMDGLAAEIAKLLSAADLVRIDQTAWWWLTPAAGRWQPVVSSPSRAPAQRKRAADTDAPNLLDGADTTWDETQ